MNTKEQIKKIIEEVKAKHTVVSAHFEGIKDFEEELSNELSTLIDSLLDGLKIEEKQTNYDKILEDDDVGSTYHNRITGYNQAVKEINEKIIKLKASIQNE